jgi:anti-anti-sigma factor
MTSNDPFIIITETPGGPTVVAIEGVLDYLGSAEARKTLDKLIADGCHQIVVDLQDVRGIDSLGIGVLLSAWCLVRKAEGNLVLWRPQGTVRRGIEMLGIGEVIEIRGE